MHVSKTAGSSVTSYLSSLFMPDEICPSPSTGIWKYSPAEVAQFRLFQGHLDHDFIDAFQQPRIKLVMLRSPYARLVSLYDYWRSYSWDFIRDHLPPPPVNGPAVAKSGSFADFLNTDNAFARRDIINPAARHLLGAEFDALSQDQTKAVERCLGRLATFDWIGITEEFRESIRMLSAFFGAHEPPEEVWLNRTYLTDSDTSREPVVRTEPTPEEIAMMHRVSSLDLIIYGEARRLFRQRRRID
jgi:hypothetical protein